MHGLVILAALVGLFIVIAGVAGAKGAPQEAAAAAIGLAVGVLPYIMYKAYYCHRVLQQQQKLIELLSAAKPSG